MPTKKYTITILNGVLKGQTIVKYSLYETELIMDGLKTLLNIDSSLVIESTI